MDVNIKYFDSNSKDGILSKTWSLSDDIIHSEDLTFKILDSLGVGPVYRYLFALKFSEKNLWLRPNQDIRQNPFQLDEYIFDVDKIDKHIRHDRVKLEPTFELRMRFKPTFLGRLAGEDPSALHLIFSQLRYDFLQSASFILNMLHEKSVALLIYSDILRHRIDNHIDSNEQISAREIKNFIPKSGLSMLIPLMLLFCKDDLSKLENLTKTNQDSNSINLKKNYVDLYLREINKDYNTEIYQAKRIDSQKTLSGFVSLRISQNFDQCLIEQSFILGEAQDSNLNWAPICNIDDVLYGSLNGKRVDIDRANNSMLSYDLFSPLRARSFLSSIHGYYRLIKKWNMDIARNIYSPSLKQLISNKVHGPIGSKLAFSKLKPQKQPGCYLVRQSIQYNNHYFIDILLRNCQYCSVQVKYNPSTKQYSHLEHKFLTKIEGNVLVLKEDFYETLDKLVEDIQIRDQSDEEVQPLVRIRPTEGDDCFSLLLCMASDKLLDIRAKELNQESIDCDLPKIIPADKVSFTSYETKFSNNRMIARVGLLKYNDQKIIYKFPESLANPTERPVISTRRHRQEALFISTKLDSDQVSLLQYVQLEQNRILDWLFVKHLYFAECIGVELSRCALVQEGFSDDRRLDKYLKSFQCKLSMSRDFSCTTPIQLAEALDYLETASIIHGKIRCHNIFIKRFEPFCIKITDPLGTFDCHEERAFIPTELMMSEDSFYLQEPQQLYPGRLLPGFDIWAFATTLWQIYSWGDRPTAGFYATLLQKPSSCIERMWSLIQDCWHPDPNCRPTAFALSRHIRSILANFDDFTYEEGYSAAENKCSMVNYVNEEQTDFINSDTSNQCLGGIRATGTRNTRKPFRKLFNKIYKRPTSDNLKGSYDDLSASSSITQSEESATTCLMTSSYGELNKVEKVTKNTALSGLIKLDNLTIESEIGRGSFGIVRRAKYFISNVECITVAVKSVSKSSSSDNNNRLVDDLKRENEILMSLEHKNIIKTFGITNESSAKMVVEYMPLGTLLSFIRNSSGKHHSLPLKEYAQDIADGMSYLEQMKIIHRDLALRNILLKTPKEVKICDFGLAVHLEPTAETYSIQSLDKAIPWKWCAPETYVSWIFSTKTDVWAYGIVLWELYSGGLNPQYPGTIKELPKLFENGGRLPKPRNCPDGIHDLMKKCWAFDPKDRPSFSLISQSFGSSEIEQYVLPMQLEMTQ